MLFLNRGEMCLSFRMQQPRLLPAVSSGCFEVWSRGVAPSFCSVFDGCCQLPVWWRWSSLPLLLQHLLESRLCLENLQCVVHLNSVLFWDSAAIYIFIFKCFLVVGFVLVCFSWLACGFFLFFLFLLYVWFFCHFHFLLSFPIWAVVWLTLCFILSHLFLYRKLFILYGICG